MQITLSKQAADQLMRISAADMRPLELEIAWLIAMRVEQLGSGLPNRAGANRALAQLATNAGAHASEGAKPARKTGRPPGFKLTDEQKQRLSEAMRKAAQARKAEAQAAASPAPVAKPPRKAPAVGAKPASAKVAKAPKAPKAAKLAKAAKPAKAATKKPLQAKAKPRRAR